MANNEEETNEESHSNENEINDLEIQDFDDLETDIVEINSDENEIQYSSVMENDSNDANDLNDSNSEDETSDIEFNFEEEYDLENNQIIKELNIKLGSDEIPRYQCANHKLDLVARKAIKFHRRLTEITRKLNKSNAHCRKTIKLSKVFRKKKCRLRLENKTRWSSVYLLLLSTKKAYDKGAFDHNDPEKRCPVSLQTIETFLRILKPLYMLNVSFQSDHSTIADVIPGIDKNF